MEIFFDRTTASILIIKIQEKVLKVTLHTMLYYIGCQKVC